MFSSTVSIKIHTESILENELVNHKMFKRNGCLPNHPIHFTDQEIVEV